MHACILQVDRAQRDGSIGAIKFPKRTGLTCGERLEKNRDFAPITKSCTLVTKVQSPYVSSYGTNTESSLNPDIIQCSPVLLPHLPNDNDKLLPQRCGKLCVLCLGLNLTLLS